MLPLLLAGIAGMIGKDVKDIGDKRDQDKADAAQIRSAAADAQQPTLNEPGDGMGPSAYMAPSSPLSSGVAAYGTEQQAQDATTAYNSADSKVQRIQNALLTQGKVGDAQTMEKSNLALQDLRRKYSQMIKDEGVNTFIDNNMANAPSVDDIKAGRAGTFDLQGLDDFNKIGVRKMPDGARGRWKVLQLGNGREVPDFEVVGADGNPVGPFSARTLQSIHAMTLHERETLADKQFQEGQNSDQKDREFESLDAYRKAMAAAATEKADKAGAPKSLIERLPPGVKESYDALTSEEGEIVKAITKSQADETFDPSKPGAKALTQRRAAIQLMKRQLLEPFLPKQGGGGDPLGLRGNDAGAQADDPNAPPAFQVTGDPKAFRKKLANQLNRGVSPQTLAAFDAQLPGAKGAAAAPSAAAPAPAEQPSAMSTLLARIGAYIKPNWDAQAQTAILAGDRSAMSQMLAPGSDSAAGLSPAMKQRLQAALATP
ncbi:MAG: hypothetical protein QM762_08740 [Chryseolinea sp.]